jgi:Holliday junction resolvase RusA-like endonuclease
VTTIHLVGEPMPKQRPRVGRGKHVYTPRETVDAELAIRWQLVAQKIKPTKHPWLEITMVIRTGNHRRSDLDNFQKLCWDALNGYAWDDDSQIVESHVYLRRGHPNPGISLAIRELTEQEATREQEVAA